MPPSLRPPLDFLIPSWNRACISRTPRSYLLNSQHGHRAASSKPRNGTGSHDHPKKASSDRNGAKQEPEELAWHIRRQLSRPNTKTVRGSQPKRHAGRPLPRPRAHEKPSRTPPVREKRRGEEPIANIPAASNKGPNAPSLFEAFFPEKTLKSTPRAAETPKAQSELPRAPMPTGAAAETSKAVHRSAIEEKLDARRAQLMQRLLKREDKTAVLALFNASKSLDANDFRALVPRGQHISEWPVESDILKVIPQRHPFSLEKTGTYYLVFATEAAALAYQSNATKAFEIAQQETMTSLMGPIPPAPGLLEDGVDVHEVLRSFTLAPPRHNFTLELVRKHTYSESLTSILKAGGYVPIVDFFNDKPGAEHPSQVLLFVRGSSLTHNHLRRAILADGADRGEPWPIHEYGIRKLVDVMERAQLRGYLPHWKLTPAEVLAETMNRWIISFKDVTTAKRFAYSWHRRTVETKNSLTQNYTHPDTILTELLW